MARVLGVSTATVYRLCREWKVAHLRVANAVRVRAADLDAFIAARTRG